MTAILTSKPLGSISTRRDARHDLTGVVTAVFNSTVGGVAQTEIVIRDGEREWRLRLRGESAALIKAGA